MANQKNKLKRKYRHTSSNAGERGWPSHDGFFFFNFASDWLRGSREFFLDQSQSRV